jgi:hypothetical protein
MKKKFKGNIKFLKNKMKKKFGQTIDFKIFKKIS